MQLFARGRCFPSACLAVGPWITHSNGPIVSWRRNSSHGSSCSHAQRVDADLAALAALPPPDEHCAAGAIAPSLRRGPQPRRKPNLLRAHACNPNPPANRSSALALPTPVFVRRRTGSARRWEPGELTATPSALASVQIRSPECRYGACPLRTRSIRAAKPLPVWLLHRQSVGALTRPCRVSLSWPPLSQSPEGSGGWMPATRLRDYRCSREARF
jgi:hypothetical protein